MAADADAGLRMLRVRIKAGSPFLSYVAIKAHMSGKQRDSPSLFLSGIPLGLDEESVEQVFACFGDIQQVVLHPNKRSGMVLFDSADSVKAALAAAESGAVIECPLPEGEAPAGLKAWVHEHKAQRPGNKVLQKQLDDWVESHEEEEERKHQQKLSAMAEDGWTVVVRSKGRAKTTEEGSMSVRSGGMAAAAAKAKQVAGLPVEDKFYRFQQRDKRRTELMDLREQFEQDRKRIAELRQSRNFKPY